jgi:Ca-activated chloride channel family protein
MRVTRYSRYTGKWWEGLDLEDLLGDLGQFLLQSGFHGRASDDLPEDAEDDGTLAELMRAILEALAVNGRVRFQDVEDWLAGEDTEATRDLSRLLGWTLDRLAQEGYLRLSENRTGGSAADPPGPVRFELTSKAVDFLGYRALRDLLGSLGRSSVGRHDTRALATGVEAAEASRRYEFGDTLNLDIPATLLHAIQREGLRLPLPLAYEDLRVHQSEYLSACATVLMLDCSHSMILYGEDRFTPAKRVALALAHLIRTQYPGDSLQVVLFHDGAEEVPPDRLARVAVGPYHTNTQAGLRLARRLLTGQRTDMRQIVMITDGKPSAITLADNRVYKNPMGLDPWILDETFREVAACRRAGIPINTFMLAQDPDLVAFVHRVSAMCRGKAYFTTPRTLGQYLLLDYVARKARRIH